MLALCARPDSAARCPYLGLHRIGILPVRTAGFPTCRIADFLIGRPFRNQACPVSGPSAGWETRDTADWEVCGRLAAQGGPPVVGNRQMPVRCRPGRRFQGQNTVPPASYALRASPKTVFTQAWWSRYHRMVSRRPCSNWCAGVQPSSRWILPASMA